LLSDCHGGAHVRLRVDLGEVPIQGCDAAAVVDYDVIAKSVRVVPRECHNSARSSDDGALRGGEIHAVMHTRGNTGNRVDARAEPRGDGIGGVDKWHSPLPCRAQRSSTVDGDLAGSCGNKHGSGNHHKRERRAEEDHGE